MKLNHVNIISTDLPADRAMYERHFGLKCLTARGKALLVMTDDNGTVLLLNDLPRKRGDFAYPDDFDVMHIGFLQETREAVDAVHAQLVADGWETQAPRDYHGAWTFYFKAKGGYYVEVGTASSLSRYEAERREHDPARSA